MSLVSLNGTELHYQRLGKAQAGVAPVVMIHGLLVGNLAGWYFGAARELAPSHEVILYDLRGHGLSQASDEGYTIETMVADLRSFLKTHQSGWPSKAAMGLRS